MSMVRSGLEGKIRRFKNFVPRGANFCAFVSWNQTRVIDIQSVSQSVSVSLFISFVKQPVWRDNLILGAKFIVYLDR